MIYSIHSRQTWALQTSSKLFLSVFVFLFVTLSHAATTDDAKVVEKRKKEVTVLPLITFYDVEKDATYNWWSEKESESLDAKKHSAHLMKWLAKDNGKVIHFIDPYAANVKFRENLQKTVLSVEEMQAIAKDLNTEIFLVGDVVVNKSTVVPDGHRLKINITLLRAPAFNKVGEIYRIVDLYAVDYTRFLETGVGIWDDVRMDVEKRIEDYKPSPLKRLELIVNGSFDHHQVEQFQRHLKNHISNIKDISKGFQERDTFGIFVEYAGQNTDQLSRELKEAKLEGFMTQVVSSTSSQVIFDVRPQTAVK